MQWPRVARNLRCCCGSNRPLSPSLPQPAARQHLKIRPYVIVDGNRELRNPLRQFISHVLCLFSTRLVVQTKRTRLDVDVPDTPRRFHPASPRFAQGGPHPAGGDQNLECGSLSRAMFCSAVHMDLHSIVGLGNGEGRSRCLVGFLTAQCEEPVYGERIHVGAHLSWRSFVSGIRYRCAVHSRAVRRYPVPVPKSSFGQVGGRGYTAFTRAAMRSAYSPPHTRAVGSVRFIRSSEKPW
ncbi:hypothetical protein NONI108955_22725 [Nocardia ninae]